MAYRDRHDRQVRLERVQRDLVQCELSYRVWAPTASWQMGLERLNLEVLEPRPTRRELARTRIEDIVEQALAADICECVTTARIPEPARLASVLYRWAVWPRVPVEPF